MKKRIIFPLLLGGFAVLLSACGQTQVTETESISESEVETETESQEETIKVVAEISVMTSFAGKDSNAERYKEAAAAWESDTGNSLTDMSQELNDEYRARVIDDFEQNETPDVVYFYTGAKANEFIEKGQVVSIEEIRQDYPEYASNMDDRKLPVSLDGEKYAVPVNGVWEALYVNKAVLKEAKVDLPGKNYTWEEFVKNCQDIKAAKKTAIAASMGKMPDYWIEYAVFNESGVGNNMLFPEDIKDTVAENWKNACLDLQELFGAGAWPVNTMAIDDAAAFKQFINGDAAFLLDGSWRMGDIAEACLTTAGDWRTLDQEKLDNFTVVYVPAKGSRKATDLIGGSTMGYYITRKAWEDQDKRDALVSFVETMTSDQMVAEFAGIGAQALKEAPQMDVSQFNSLQLAGFELVKGATGWTGTLLNNIEAECADAWRTNAANAAVRRVSPENAVQSVLNTHQRLVEQAIRESQSKAESESRRESEKESKAKVESESKARAESESESRAKAESELKAKQESESESKAKAESELKAKQESESRAKAREESDAALRKEIESRSKAEIEAKSKEAAELKAKQESESKAKAESESKAKAESAANKK